MLSRRALRRVTQGVLCAMMFAQAAFAAAACEQVSMAPAQAFAAAMGPTCHEAPATNANLCLAHCLSTDQRADVPQLAMPVLAPAPVLAVALPDLRQAHFPAAARHALPRPAAPPPRILFQTFLI